MTPTGRRVPSPTRAARATTAACGSDATRGGASSFPLEPAVRCQLLGHTRSKRTPPGAESIHRVEVKDVPEGRGAIAHADLLALVVRTAVVGDRNLVDAQGERRHVRRDLHLHPET